MIFTLKEGILFIIAGIDVGLALFVVLKNPKKIVNWTFAAVPLGTAIWAVGLAMLSISQGNLVWEKLIFGSSFFIFPLLVVFSDTFPDKVRFERWYPWVFLPGFILLFALPSDLILKVHVVRETQILKVTGPLYPLYNVYVLTYLAWTTFNLLRKYREAVAVVKLQLYYLLFGFFVFVLFGLITQLILPLLKEPELIMLGPAASLFFVTFTTYAIVGYRLMDVRAAIQRGIVVLILVAAGPPLFFTIYRIISQFAPPRVGWLLLFAAFLTLLILLLGGTPLLRLFPNLTERLFFRGTYLYPEIVTKLTEICNKVRSAEELGEEITRMLVATFKTEKVVFLLKDATERNFFSLAAEGFDGRFNLVLDGTDDLINYVRRKGDIFLTEEIEEDTFTKETLIRLRGYGCDLFIPVKVRGTLEGLILLGRKSSGGPYTTRDINLLRVVAGLTGIALENVRLYTSLGEAGGGDRK